jgi:hypothetical protein
MTGCNCHVVGCQPGLGDSASAGTTQGFRVLSGVGLRFSADCRHANYVAICHLGQCYVVLVLAIYSKGPKRLVTGEQATRRNATLLGNPISPDSREKTFDESSPRSRIHPSLAGRLSMQDYTSLGQASTTAPLNPPTMCFHWNFWKQQRRPTKMGMTRCNNKHILAVGGRGGWMGSAFTRSAP